MIEAALNILLENEKISSSGADIRLTEKEPLELLVSIPHHTEEWPVLSPSFH